MYFLHRSPRRVHQRLSKLAPLCEMTWYLTSGSARGFKWKNPPGQKAWRVSEGACELYQLFSSFLRGASRPKSPRDAVTTAPSIKREEQQVVKTKIRTAPGLRRESRSVSLSWISYTT